MQIKDIEVLKSWLVQTLTPICDADPAALAKYVMALLKKDRSFEELKKVCLEQLDVFLQESTTHFVETLFDALENESYITESGPSTSAPEAATLDGKKKPHTREKKRSKGSPPSEHLSRSKSQTDDGRTDRRKSGDHKNNNSENSKERSRSPIRAPESDTVISKKEPIIVGGPPRFPGGVKGRVRCRDFDEKGFCLSGDQCPYDHGRDPVVVEDMALSRVVPFPGGSNDRGYVPHGVPPPMQHIPNIRPRGAFRGGAGAGPNSVHRNIVTLPMVEDSGMGGQVAAPVFPPSVQVMPVQARVNMRGNMRGRGMMGGRGRGGMMHHGARGGGVGGNQNCTLQVTRIPRVLNNVGKISEHFSQFGTIVSVQINPEEEIDTARVTFSSHQEAMSAYRSPDPIFANRFVRVFFYDPTHAQQQKPGQPAPQAAEQQPMSSARQIMAMATAKMQQVAAPLTERLGRKPAKDRLGPVRNRQVADSSDEEAAEQAEDSVRRPRKRSTRSDDGENMDSGDEAGMEDSRNVISAASAAAAAAVTAAAKKTAEKAKIQEDRLRTQTQLRIQKELRVKQMTLLQGYRKQLSALVVKLEKAKSLPEKRKIVATVKVVNTKVRELEKELKLDSNLPPNKKDAQKQMLDLEMEIYNKELSREPVTDLKKKMVELKRTLATGGVTRRRSSSTSGKTIPMAPVKLPTAAQTKLDKRPRTLYITGHDEDQYDMLMTELAVSGLRVTQYKQEVLEGTPVAVVTFGSRAEAEQSILQFQNFHGKTLKLEWFRPQLDSKGENNAKSEIPEEAANTETPIATTPPKSKYHVTSDGLDSSDDEDALLDESVEVITGTESSSAVEPLDSVLDDDIETGETILGSEALSV